MLATLGCTSREHHGLTIFTSTFSSQTIYFKPACPFSAFHTLGVKVIYMRFPLFICLFIAAVLFSLHADAQSPADSIVYIHSISYSFDHVPEESRTEIHYQNGKEISRVGISYEKNQPKDTGTVTTSYDNKGKKIRVTSRAAASY